MIISNHVSHESKKRSGLPSVSHPSLLAKEQKTAAEGGKEGGYKPLANRSGALPPTTTTNAKPVRRACWKGKDFQSAQGILPHARDVTFCFVVLRTQSCNDKSSQKLSEAYFFCTLLRNKNNPPRVTGVCGCAQQAVPAGLPQE